MSQQGDNSLRALGKYCNGRYMLSISKAPMDVFIHRGQLRSDLSR